MHFIEEVFGEGCNLYDILQCPRDADRAKLRKCYYRAALQYHPDRNTSSEGEEEASKNSHQQFQAISMAYQILGDADSRADYDESGLIPDDAPDEDDQAATKQGCDAWKTYFDQIFGKVTRGDIEAFATKYKCSDEERRDVLKEFTARKGNLVKMLDFVMLSEPRDASRWVEDYLMPAMQDGSLEETFKATMEKTLKTCQKKAEKESIEEMEQEEEEDVDDEETESEGEEEVPPPPKRKESNKTSTSSSAATKTKKPTPKKAKPTQAKVKNSRKNNKKQKNYMTDLVAAIQNKNSGNNAGNNSNSNGGLFASLGARYGVSMEDDNDPLADADFERIQSNMKKKQQQRRK